MNNIIKKKGNDFEVESIDSLILCAEDVQNKTPQDVIYNQAKSEQPYCVSNKPCGYKKLIGRDTYCMWYIVNNKEYNE